MSSGRHASGLPEQHKLKIRASASEKFVIREAGKYD
jgi:hypothetical protein